MLHEQIRLLENITADILDMPVEDINVKAKTQKQVLARLIICNILMQGGVTPTTLSRYFCKHRTNFYHYQKLHTHYTKYPLDYPPYNDNYILVLNRFEEETNLGSVADNLKKAEAIDEIDLAIANLQNYKSQLV